MNKSEMDLLRRQVEELKAENVMLKQKMMASSLDDSSACESEELLNATQRLSKVGGWEWNIEKQTMFWTEEAYRIHDFVNGELVPGSPEHIDKSLACYKPADRPLVHNAFLRCAERGDPYDFELPFTTATGRKLWVRTTAQPVWDNDRIVSVVGNIMDITDRKSVQVQLAESERRLSTLMANLPGIAYRCLNDEFWTMKFVSNGCLDLTGFPPDHLLENHRTNYAELIHPDDRQVVWDKIQNSLERRSQFNLTYRIHCADGKEKWVLEIGQGVFTDTGDLLAIEGFITDITERIKTVEERAKLENQKRQLQKAESLGCMAGAIAHRFNNLLGAVLGNLEIAMGDLSAGADVIKNLIEAIQAARKAAEVSGLMLTYLGQTRTKADVLDLSETCRRSLPMLRAALPKDVVLKADLPSKGPIILANPNQIQQLLTNICTNAWEAVGSNRGAIQLTVKVVPPAEIPTTNRFPLDWQPQDMNYACLEVADPGSGIAGKDVEKLFDPFFSSKFTGRGLGLPVVLGVLRAYRGAVAVESKPGRGSVFRAYFPVSTEEVSLQSENPAKALQIKKDGTVLLVEDNDALRRLTDTVLKDLGFNVLATSDGTEAIEVFRQHKEEICFVLCDLTMPLMDGWETITSLRKLSPDIPVILTSGFNEAQVMAGDHPTLPDAFLSKPYVRKELIAAIGQALSVKN